MKTQTPARSSAVRSPRAWKRTRRGASAVEFALVSPIVFALFFAALEFSRVAMIRHAADNAVYEACRAGIVPGATIPELNDKADEAMGAVGINDYDLDITPPVLSRDTDEVTVSVVVDIGQNTFLPAQFFAGRQIARQLTLRREGIRD